MAEFKIIEADAITGMRGLPADHFHCVVTSPPYFGLRKYPVPPLVWGGDPACEHEWKGGAIDTTSKGNQEGSLVGDQQFEANRFRAEFGFCLKCGGWRGQLGLEPTPDLYVQHLVDVFREVRRVLRPDGVAWLNLGDSYNGSGGAGGDYNAGGLREGQEKYPGRNWSELKPKDLMFIPARTALALQADGWWVRQDNVWAKKNCMPESVGDWHDQLLHYPADHEQAGERVPCEQCNDGGCGDCWEGWQIKKVRKAWRTTRAHEFMFQLAKSEHYFCDAASVRESDAGRTGSAADFKRKKEGPVPPGHRHASRRYDREPTSATGTRNLRTVWTIATRACKEAHFATFPYDLIEPCIRASTSERGCCAACGAPWVRVIEKGQPASARGSKRKHLDVMRRAGESSAFQDGAYQTYESLGWRPSCECSGETVPCRVLDPFCGIGNAGVVALKLGLDFTGIELAEEYAELSRDWIRRQVGLFAEEQG